jgi:nucleoside-diphosphate-sugar epimerase
VIPTFCEQAIAGDALTVFGDGGQERCPTAVWDLVDYVVNHAVDGPDVVNVGNPNNRTSVIGLAHRVRSLARPSGQLSPIVYTSGKEVHGPDFEEAEGRIKTPNAGLAASTGWRPRVGLDEMIVRTLQEIEAVTAHG